MVTNELTGRKRIREQRRWFRPTLFVVQVEVHYQGFQEWPYDGLYVDCKVWRDATLTDVNLKL